MQITLDAGAFVRETADTVLDISAIAVDQSGVQHASAKQTPTLTATRQPLNQIPVVVPTSMELPSGDYEIRVAVTDSSSDARASVFSQIVMPKFGTERLSLSDVVLETGPATTARAAASATPVAHPTTARTFRRADQVRAFFQIYQGTARTDPLLPVTARARMIDARGAVARDHSVAFVPSDFQARRADCRFDVIDGLPATAARTSTQAIPDVVHAVRASTSLAKS